MTTKGFKELNMHQSSRVRQDEPPPFMTARQLMRRWNCSRSSVARIAARAGIRRCFLGEGRNGMVRYHRGDVERFERARIE